MLTRSVTAFLLCSGAVALHAQRIGLNNPATRSRPAEPGAMIGRLTGSERQIFAKGLEIFEKVNSVQGDAFIPETESGLGPTFNLDRCAGCHAYPATGGSNPSHNPLVDVATKEGAANRVPSFVKPAGPAFQVRFRRHPDGSLDGAVHPLYTIRGRRDAANCELTQPDFEKEYSAGNLSFRIPPPLFGAGLIEAIPDALILRNQAAGQERKHKLGISGRPSRSQTDGGIARFGWKAHGRSLEVFAAEAYLIEQGVTSEIFPEKRGSPPPGCVLNPTPEDRKNLFARRGLDAQSNVSLLAQYLRFLAPPAPSLSDRAVPGRQIFDEVGCSLCHTPQLRTGRSAWPALADQPVPLYSDLLLHHLGAALADGVVEGDAGPDEFRTPPLWGLGQRLFFLHDGRTQDLAEAIRAHSDKRSRPVPRTPRYVPSEANQVIRNFQLLTAADQQALLDFLRSL